MVIVWGAVFSNDLIFFSAHPVSYTKLQPPEHQQLTTLSSQLLNSAAFAFLIQGIMILQPTHTAKQKKQGTYVHAAFNDIALGAAIAGLVIIEINKAGAHQFQSVHSILGLVTYILIFLQALVGATQYFVPALYGGVDNAKAIYKYHRTGGYLTVLLMLATICAATFTTFNVNVLGIQLVSKLVAGKHTHRCPIYFGTFH